MSTDPNASTERHSVPVKRWAAVAVLFLASFMNLIDVTIVNVALPQIQADTGATSTQLKWVAEAYVLGLAVGLLPFGRFGDVFGRQQIFAWGLVGFTAASIVCGLAPNVESLIAARAVQGSAAAMMVPQVLAIVHVIFPPDEKARVFGLFGTISSLGVVAGPVIGGALISADVAGLGWRLAFLINVPLGLAVLVGTWMYLPRFTTDRDTRTDWIGMALFATTAFLLVFPLIEGRAHDWPWWIFALFAASAPMGFAFTTVERKRSARGASALMPPGLLGNPAFLGHLGLVTLLFSGIPGLFLVLAIFLQTGFGLSALESGLVTTPFPIGVMAASILTERFREPDLRARIAAGAGLLVIGMLGLVLVLQATKTLPNVYAFAPALLTAGLGMGMAVISLFQVTMASVAPQDAGAGSGAMQAFQQIGAALGIAIAGQIFFSVLGDAGMDARGEIAPRFVTAASWATIYSIVVFSLLTVLVGWQALRDRKTAR